MKKKITSAFFLVFILILPTKSQVTSSEWAGNINVLTPATPFVNISPLAEVQALGSVRSVSFSQKQSGHFLNPAIAARNSGKLNIAGSYMPWLREIVPGASLSGMSVSRKINDKQAISADFTFFRFKINLINPLSGNEDMIAREMIGSLGYSRILGDNTTGGIRIKYINSNLTDNKPVGGVESRPGRSLAVDLGYNIELTGPKEKMEYQFGAGINNLGSKISYSKDSDKDFIPTSLNIGCAVSLKIVEDNSVSVGYEVEKLLIPTPPVYYPDSLDLSNDPVIQFGYDPDVSVMKGMIQSFYDAPGGYREELHEIIHHFGLNYSNNWLSISGGLVLGHCTKGKEKYASFGLGLNLRKFNVNTFYLLPFQQNSYLKNTMGVSLGMNI